MPRDEYAIDNNVCNTIKSGFIRASTLGNNDPTTLENYQSYEIFDKSGFGEVMTLFYDNPTNFGRVSTLHACGSCREYVM